MQVVKAALLWDESHARVLLSQVSDRTLSFISYPSPKHHVLEHLPLPSFPSLAFHVQSFLSSPFAPFSCFSPFLPFPILRQALLVPCAHSQTLIQIPQWFVLFYAQTVPVMHRFPSNMSVAGNNSTLGNASPLPKSQHSFHRTYSKPPSEALLWDPLGAWVFYKNSFCAVHGVPLS